MSRPCRLAIVVAALCAAPQLAVAAPAPVDAAALATVEVHTQAKLRSGSSAPLYVTVANRSAHALTVGDPRLVAPERFTAGWSSPPAGARRVAPGQALVLAGALGVPDRVRAGSEPLIVAVPLASRGGRRLTVVATRTVDVVRSGESEVLTALGVPALVLAPGFLVIATMSLLATLGLRRQAWDTRPFPFDLASKELWAVVVIGSIALVWLYGAVTDTDLLDVYGLPDLVRLWVASIALGLLLYAIWIETRNARHGRRVPRAQDEPIALLRKLARQRLGVVRDRTAVTANGQQRVLYLLEPADVARPTTWLSPAIEFGWVDGGDERLQQAVTASLDCGDDPATLADVLEQALDGRAITLRYSPEGHEFGGPREVAREKLGEPRTADPIVQEGAP